MPWSQWSTNAPLTFRKSENSNTALRPVAVIPCGSTPMSGGVKIAQRVKNSRTVFVSECGHWLMVEYPKLFNETTLKFLKGELG